LVRECKEELDIVVAVNELFAEVTYSYPDIEVHLNVFEASIESGVLKKLEHNDIRWIGCDEIINYKFCPADVLVLEKIKEKCLSKK
ncbi:MAG: 8-oxo-dGTP diphosphatase MutT, partial [Clostridia bacterium]